MRPLKLPLTRAVTDGDIEAVRALLAAGSDVNRTTGGGQTPLILAIVFSRLQILSLLLEAGADPQLRDSLGLNAFDWAERRGFVEGVKLLAQTHFATHETTPEKSSTETPHLPESVPPLQVEPQNPPVSKEQLERSDEKSLRWIAGLKRRIDEETSHKVKDPQLAPPATSEIESASEEEPRVVVTNSAISVTLPEPEVVAAPPNSLTNVAPETSQLKDQAYSAQTVKPGVSREAVARAQQPWSPYGKPPMSFSRKRCPKCNTVYNSELLAYCAIDMTPLVDANKPLVTSPSETVRMPLLWFLVVFTFIVAAGVTYFMIPNLKSAQNVAPETSPTQAVNIGESPLVSGELSGKQVNVPEPQYPGSAKSEHVTGTVTVRITVDKKGSVIAVKVVEGDRRLRNAAIAAAQKATFSPEKLMGRGGVGTIAYKFK